MLPRRELDRGGALECRFHGQPKEVFVYHLRRLVLA